MKTRIEYDGKAYTVFVNDEPVAAFAGYPDAERCLFAITKVSPYLSFDARRSDAIERADQAIGSLNEARRILQDILR
jgi:hypothetical protein